MDKCHFEYEEQSQGYVKDISKTWFSYWQKLQNIEQDLIFFNFQEANSPKDKARFYIRSKDYVFFNLFRSLLLPIITSLSIAKVKFAKSQEISFYFYPYLHSHEKFNHPQKIEREIKKIEENSKIKETTKKQLVNSRIGQGIFRKRIIDSFGECVITRVGDERILQASHIKPWGDCSDKERLDKNNGLLFTPTCHRLFDLGFISFNEKGELLVSYHVSERDIKKLNLEALTIYNLNMNEERAKYLEYHREEVFKK